MTRRAKDFKTKNNGPVEFHGHAVFSLVVLSSLSLAPPPFTMVRISDLDMFRVTVPPSLALENRRTSGN